MSNQSELLQLIRSTITALDKDEMKLSAAIRGSIRIARLRNDFLNLLWLQREIIDNQNEYERRRTFSEIIPHFTKDQFDNYNKYFLEMWMSERPVIVINDDGSIEKSNLIIAKSVSELENELEGMLDTYKNAQTPSGMHPLDTASVEKQNFYLRLQTQAYIHHYQKILSVIKNRVYDFLSQTEKQLTYGQFHADIFEQNRQFVELRLNQVCPEGLKEFSTALQRVGERTPETNAQALLSCRRLLKDLADVLYPSTNQKFTGGDGKARDLSEEKFVNRLWQFISEKTQISTSVELLQASLDDLGHRLDRIYDFTNKGVHSEVDEFEMNQCLIQTYLLIGDLLRIFDKQSAIGVNSTGFQG
jgi:hypothetical protein